MRQTVLIADDSPTIQRVVTLALSDENVDIAVAETGKDAIIFDRQGSSSFS